MLPFGGVIFGRLKVFVVEDFFVTAYEHFSGDHDGRKVWTGVCFEVSF